MKQKTLSNRDLIRRIISFAKPFRKAFGVIFFCIFLVTIVDALNNYFISQIFDVVQKHGTDVTYLSTAFWFMGIATILWFSRIMIIGYQAKMRTKKLSLKIQNYLNHESIAKFFSFSNGQHINEHSGVKQSIVNNGTSSIRNQMDLLFYRLFPVGAQFFVALGVLLFSSFIIGSIFLVMGCIFCLMMYKMNKDLVPGIRKIRDRNQLNSRLISDLYRFVTLVKNESQEEKSLDDLSIAQEKHQDVFVETWLPTIDYLQIVRAITSTLRYGSMFLVVYLLFEKKISAGAMFLIFTYSSQFMNSLWDFMDMHQQFLLDRINIEKYFELLEVKPDVVIVENPIRPEKFLGKIEFKNVSFWYPKRVKTYEEANNEEDNIQDESVLKSVSFTINAGEKIGIVGESGSGKSTLASLIRRGFDPQEGQILVDGNDLRLLDLNYLLKHVGNVDQEVALFDRSIRDNILFGLNGEAGLITNERLHEIAKMARIDAFFDRLEHGFDTVVGEKGVKLSGGERQRVGIARALAKDPPILIFDEATSALDSVSERIVQQSIDDVSEGKTAVIIAHRLSTVKNCDRILVFRHGLLLDEGSHEELLNRCEYYAHLVKHQMVTV